MQFRFSMACGQVEELECVRIAKDADRIWISLCHQWCHFGRMQDHAFK
jgi:hypothetical protein